MFKFAIPVLHVARSMAAEEFYCHRLGFRQDFAYRPFDGLDPCYMGLVRDAVELHLSSFPGDGGPRGVVFVGVKDVDALHDELIAKGVAISLPPTEQSWGNREMYINDPDGNSIRFVQARS
ncbi:MAG TPA: VOC family protein [Pyrinomonadaceae bacterium]|jgi:catechol 2,3-dioxygenase-like lactoylglutathione lyase family enzyme